MSAWITARRARHLDLRSLGGNVIEWASLGLVKSRARAIRNPRGHAGYDRGDDGCYHLPAQFWEDMRALPGSEYRRWDAGTFYVLRGQHAQVQAYLVEFDEGDLLSVLGIAMETPLAAEAEPSSAPLSLDDGLPVPSGGKALATLRLFHERLNKGETLPTKAAEYRAIYSSWPEQPGPSEDTWSRSGGPYYDRLTWPGNKAHLDPQTAAKLANITGI